jgi:hypothetical protein
MIRLREEFACCRYLDDTPVILKRCACDIGGVLRRVSEEVGNFFVSRLPVPC